MIKNEDNSSKKYKYSTFILIGVIIVGLIAYFAYNLGMSQNNKPNQTTVSTTVPTTIITTVPSTSSVPTTTVLQAPKSSCVAGPGFSCSNIFYSHSTNQLLATIGQSTGATWAASIFAYVPAGTSVLASGVPVSVFSYRNYQNESNPGPLTSGQKTTTTFTLGNVPANTGTVAVGSIWACYAINNNETPGPITIIENQSGGCIPSVGQAYYVEIATINATAS